MTKKLLISFLALFCVVQPGFAKIVCEPGYNRFGVWESCLKAHREPGAPEGRRPVDANRIGEVEKVRKNLDGSVTVWRHGASETEEWAQTDKDTWERKR